MNQRPGEILLGMMQLATFRAEGMSRFGATPRAFLNSLAPLVAFPLAGGVMGVLAGEGLEAVAAFLGTLVALLAPPVLSELFAARWGREREWLRYATAFNWSRWVMLLALAVALALVAVLAAGLGQRTVTAALALVAVYGAVLDWFIARVGLALVWWRAVVLVLGVNVGTAVLFIAPRLLAGWAST